MTLYEKEEELGINTPELRQLGRDLARGYEPDTLESALKAIAAANNQITTLLKENERLREVIKKSLSPEYQTCDGTWCTGCWKDLAREALKDTQ